ncbi:MAG: oligosaccharide flippase family protein, partial [Candidatus Latescibacterota bacterium]
RRHLGAALPHPGCSAGVRAYLGYAAPIWLSDSVGTLSRYVDRAVVLHYFSWATFAAYQLGALEVPVSLLLAAVATVLVPEVSALYHEGQQERIGALWHQAVGRLALVVLPLFFFLFTFADSLAVALYTERYAESGWVLRILVVALPVRCAVYNPLLIGTGKPRWALWGSLADLALNALLSVGLVHLLREGAPAWAFLAPAVATVLATYAQVAGLICLIARHLGWRLALVLPWRRLLRIAGLCALAAAVALAASGWVAVGVARLGLGGIAFAASLGLLLWRCPQERSQVRSVLSVLRGR